MKSVVMLLTILLVATLISGQSKQGDVVVKPIPNFNPRLPYSTERPPTFMLDSIPTPERPPKPKLIRKGKEKRSGGFFGLFD